MAYLIINMTFCTIKLLENTFTHYVYIKKNVPLH
jgi:hypothetical protein